MCKALLTLVFLSILYIGNCQNHRIIVVTGGHSYDTIQFFEMFDQFEGIEYEHFFQPEANVFLTKENVDNFDLLVFYDMWKEINEVEKKAYLDLTKAGKPFLFLHHSIASYQNWPEFEKIVGGKYIEPGEGIKNSDLSTYEHDVWINYKTERKCSITKGLDTFRLYDEVYGNIKISDDVVPLISTNHRNSSKIVGWKNKYNKSTIIYLQPGHDRRAYSNPKYRQLLLQSIRYLTNSK